MSGLLRRPEAPPIDTLAGGGLNPLVRAYAAWWFLSLFAFTTGIAMAVDKTVPTLIDNATLEDKLAYYDEHKSEFNLILVGDSLTYTGLHPEFIDPELGTHSINMAHFSHWFATQYPFVQDLIPEIPRGTRVLWSVHPYDFNDAGLSVQRVYPVGLANAIRYWSWGAHNAGLADNVLYYNPLTSFFVKRDELRAHLIGRGDTPVSLPRLISPAFADVEFPAVPKFVSLQKWALPDSIQVKNALMKYYSGLPFVGAADPVSDHGQINSVVLQLKRGGYYRIELMPEYFQEKQREMARSVWHPDDKTAKQYTPAPLGPVSVKTFKAILAAFRQASIPVTVNVMEEAPWTLPNEIIRKKIRRLTDETLKPIVRSYGDDYVHVDYSSILDSDYFDYNHFNSNGVAKYTPLLVRELRNLPEFSHSAAK
jgi:hypothetical protein